MVKRVLIAEDDPSDVFFLQRAFSAAALPSTSLHFVQDGQEAIDYLEGEKAYCDRDAFPLPDLILLDLKMPRMNGFDVLDWLRKQPRLKRLLVTVLTSSDQPQDINRAYDLGANSYLLKPHSTEHLSDLVKHLQKYWLELNRCPIESARI